MKPVAVISLENNGTDEKRIGPNTRSPKTETAIGIEQLFRKIAPLPISFDISPIQHEYFQEFTYYDIFGGLYCASMNEEVNARILQFSVENSKYLHEMVKPLHQMIDDKYILNSEMSMPQAKKIAFYPGSNLLHIVDHNKLDKILFEDEEILIKPHPVFTDEGLRIIARRYGYGRIIDPAESGISYLKNATQIYTTANSEIGIAAALMKKPMIDVSTMQYLPKLTYAPIYRLFRDNQVEHNYEVALRSFMATNSGLVAPFLEDKEERLHNFCNLAMDVRQVFKPSWAWLGDRTPINKK